MTDATVPETHARRRRKWLLAALFAAAAVVAYAGVIIRIGWGD